MMHYWGAIVDKSTLEVARLLLPARANFNPVGSNAPTSLKEFCYRKILVVQPLHIEAWKTPLSGGKWAQIEVLPVGWDSRPRIHRRTSPPLQTGEHTGSAHFELHPIT